ncbi:MAG: DNA ligase-associated DEXH box helicase [Marinovum sp.]|nr:DNA ligase-associated DEXH box helicase [Marinovum sp.]
MHIPDKILKWISTKNWTLYEHQIKMFANSECSAQLLIAPTGSGKTLAGFLPTIADLYLNPSPTLHTLYISPLKALASDIKRNLEAPISELKLSITVEDRTGDTKQSLKKKQRVIPPNILLTTPESLALLMSYPEAPRIFSTLKRIVVDEIHAITESKRGDQLFLALSNIRKYCQNVKIIGLSATVNDPSLIAGWLTPECDCDIIFADSGLDPDVSILETSEPPPWAGSGGLYSIPEVINEIEKHKTTLIFHNTRAQAEIFFHNLWLANSENLPIAIHHGSLDKNQRKQVEASMVRGDLQAVVCTGSLDLGIDWGSVDLVIQIGAPRQVKRLVQRIGRANHSHSGVSKALIVPANRLEVLECFMALEAIYENKLDSELQTSIPLDVICQHLLLVACAGPFKPVDIFNEIRSITKYKNLTRVEFDKCLDFCITGGYALKKYEQWHRLVETSDGYVKLRDPRIANRLRMNAGTIQDSDTLKVKYKSKHGKSKGSSIGEVEEAFAISLTPGDTFLIGGKIVKFESLREMIVEVSRKPAKKPKIAVFSGTKFATSTLLCDRILKTLEEKSWENLPDYLCRWLKQQASYSKLPQSNSLLIETFPRNNLHYICVYGFAGRNAQQTLGLLLTKRMEEMGLNPLGFVANDYTTLVWGLTKVVDPTKLVGGENILRGLDLWLSNNAVMKRTFRSVATIAGLIERNLPGVKKSGRQATFSSDILYDTLLRYDPNHLLLQATKKEAMQGLVDFARIENMLEKTKNHITHVDLKRVSPFSAPLLLEAGRIPIHGSAIELMLDTEINSLIADAGLEY